MSSITAFAGSVPANYDKYLGPLLFEPYALDIVERLKGRRLRSVLELACGTGRVTAHLVNLLDEDGKLTATDLNADMIEVAKQRVDNEKIEWLVADAQELPFDADSFDHIICQYGVMFFPDKLKAFKEAYRVLQQGGRYFFNTWDDMKFNPRTTILRKIMEEMFADEAPEFLQKGPYSFFDREEIRRLMEEAGFTEITIEVVQKQSSYNTEDDFIKGFIDGSPLSAFLINKDDKVKTELKEKVKKAMQEQAKDYGKSVPLQALVCSGEKK
jgi:ubiquinone/menaquinone biosynthesis C-methylase UbiE